MNFKTITFALVTTFVMSSVAQAQTYTGGFDAMFLQSTADAEVAFDTDTADGSGTLEFDRSLEFAPRFWLGRVDDSGNMLRTRFFFFDDTVRRSATTGVGETLEAADLASFIETSNDQASGIASSKQEIFVFDLDFGKSCRFMDGDLLIGTGFRYADISLSRSTTLVDRIDGVSFSNTDLDLNGAGPSLFLEYERPFWSGISAFTQARASLLYGDSDGVTVEREAGDTAMTSRTSLDDIFATQEWRFGFRANKTIGGRSFFGSISSEYQYYESAQFLVGDIGLAGIGFSVGMVR